MGTTISLSFADGHAQAEKWPSQPADYFRDDCLNW